MAEEKRFLFVCVENAGRSQMAEAFFRKHAPADIHAISAGTQPRSEVNPIVADAMEEAGINIRENTPKSLTSDMIDGSVTVNMGCMDKEACPALFVKDIQDWQIPDPKGKPIEEVRKIRDQIESKVKELVSQLEKEKQ